MSGIISIVDSQDLLNILLILGLLVITSCILYITYYFVKALKTFINLADNLEEVTQNIRGRLTLRALTALPAILIALAGKFIRKRG